MPSYMLATSQRSLPESMLTEHMVADARREPQDTARRIIRFRTLTPPITLTQERGEADTHMSGIVCDERDK